MKGENEQDRRRSEWLCSAGARRLRKVRVVPGALLGAAVLVGLTACQTQGPTYPRVRPVRITDIDGYVEFVARQREREQQSKVGAGDTSYKETILEENLRLELDGYAYHPNFVEFALGGLFGLLQHDYEDVFGGRTRTSGDDGTVEEFDLNARFLKKKKYPGTVFARRSEALQPRAFLPSEEVTTTSYGVVWQYLSEKVPTAFQFNYVDVKLDPLGGGGQIEEEEPSRQRNTDLRLDTGYRFNQHNVLSFLYEHKTDDEQPFGISYDSDEVTLGHRFEFGDRHQHRLESELYTIDQRGTPKIEATRWRENLRLTHSETLRSWYRWELLDQVHGGITDIPLIDERSYYLSGTVEHRLYESLISQFSAFVQRQEFGSGSQVDRFGGYAAFAYSKRNPWGVLRASYRARFERQDRTGSDRTVEVLDEHQTFTDPEPVVLANTSIDTGTISVTAEDNVTFFNLGRDYRIRTVGDRVEMERVPTGRIADGQTVLVDYIYTVFGNFTLDTVNQDFDLMQDFTFGLRPYYRLRWQRQDLSPETSMGVTPEDRTVNIFGVEFRRGQLRLAAEYEDHDSSIVPYEAVRLSGDYTHRFKFGATASAKARWTDMDFKPPDERHTRFFTAEGRYRQPITSGLTVEGAVLYRNEDDSLSGPNEGVDVELSLEWIIRKTEIRATYDFGDYEDDFANSNYSTFFLQVRRYF